MKALRVGARSESVMHVCKEAGLLLVIHNLGVDGNPQIYLERKTTKKKADEFDLYFKRQTKDGSDYIRNLGY